ncbi:MAG: glycoside hydrolase family 2 protein [Clostridia bacterium]|nr:glycoside hydrolase family 2 protein [Clostridia bacterium]
MKKFDLCGEWRMTGNGYDVEDTVPGSVYSFLINNKLVPDPYWADNDKIFFELAEHEYSFEKKFVYNKPSCPVLLHCDGLDTLCDIYINGEHIAYTDNMHLTYEFDVTDKLESGENIIKINFHPINPYIKKKQEENPIPMCWDAMVGYSQIRKAHCMLGWDWGARFPDMGIWRDIYLLEKNSARIERVKINQTHEDGNVFITPVVKVDAEAQIKITAISPCGEKFELIANTENEILNPCLWWPNGLGEQNLYTVEIDVIQNGEVVDSKTQRIGLRTLELVRQKDKWGESFYHKVNGVDFFAMGADYIPEDNILSRITKDRTHNLLSQCKACNFNTVRVWGGGFYPDDFFFDSCDELGLVVFMDMMFACATYDPDEKMWESIKTEVEQNVSRICDHACLAVLCGNNEIEMMLAQPNRWHYPRMKDVYLEMFEDVFPKIIKSVAPEVPYIPSSPTTSGHFIEPNNDDYGDQHYWTIWNGGVPIRDYRKKYCRYLSEFGFQGMCDFKTVKQFASEEDWNLNSKVMELHERSRGAQGKILNYMTHTFKIPSDFKTLIYASQILQAEAIKTGVEHFRRNRGRCMGTLYWQLNDIYPVISWASIDYFGRWKALQYFAKRFYEPVMISCEDIGETDTRPSVLYEYGYYDYKTTATLCINNETREYVKGKVEWALRDNLSNVIEKGEQNVEIPAMDKLILETIDFNKTDLKNHLEFEFVEGERVVSGGSVIFTAYKHYEWVDPKLSLRVDGDEIIVKSEAYAKYVEIYSEDSDFILSDNFFDMEKGEKRIKIISGEAKNLKVRSVYDIK